NQSNLIISEANDVIIPASGETQIDIATASCILKPGVALGGDLNIIKTSNNGVFLSYYLNSKKKTEIAKLTQGNSVVHLYSSQLAQLKLDFPYLKEQTKIAGFLTLLDKRINTQSKIIENLESLMKGIAKKIFSKQIRFKDDTGNKFPDWEAKKLEEIIEKAQSGGTPKSTIKEYYNGEIPFLSISDMTEQGKYLKYTSKKVSESGLENSSSWIVPENSLIYSMYASVGFVSINKIPIATSQAV